MSKSGDQQGRVEECIESQHLLDEWEVEFIDSISNRLGDGRQLTEGQAEKLGKVYEKVCDE